MALPIRSSALRPVIVPIVRSPASIRLFASKSKSSSSSGAGGKDDLGVIGKGDKNARPVILEDEPPINPKDPDVRKHNEEFEKRADRAANVVDDDVNESTINKELRKEEGGVIDR